MTTYPYQPPARELEDTPKPSVRRSERFWTRARRWVSTRTHSAVDGSAGRCGYHKDDECGWDE